MHVCKGGVISFVFEDMVMVAECQLVQEENCTFTPVHRVYDPLPNNIYTHFR